MSEITSQWQSHVYCILPHPTAPHILMRQTEVGWTLPYTHFTRYVFFSDLGPISQIMQEKLNIPVTALRCVSHISDEEANSVEMIFVLENYDTGQKSTVEGQWVGRDRLTDLPLAVETQRPHLEAYLTEIEEGVVPENRRPWACEGWHDKTQAWIEAQLATVDCLLTAPIEQFDSWGLSCLLLAQTNKGRFFFKATPALPLFANEPILMAALAQLYPNHIPTPMAVEPEQRWMLLANFGADLRENASVEMRAAAFRTFGQLQIASADYIDGLLKMGCVDRRLDRFRIQIELLLADTVTLSSLDKDEIERLRTLVPKLKTICDQLENYNLPQTLIHGDLNTSNIAGSEEAILFFDWTEGSIAHPFFDMFHIFFEEDETVQIHLRDAYLTVWTAYEPMERLLEAWALAKPLCALHHAISYQHIVAHLESPYKEALDWSMPFWLGRVLKYSG